jgi:hypothetical protein
MANVKRKSSRKRPGFTDKDLQNAVRYIAKLKKWLKDEQKWQVRVRRDFFMLKNKVDQGGPGYPPPPPPPPFKP